MSVSSRPARLFIVAVAVIAVAVLLRLTVFSPKPVTVSVQRVGTGLVEESVSNSKAGTVKSHRHATLSPEVGGRLAERRVKKGQRVKKGDVLLRLASEDLSAQVTLRERTLEATLAAEREACSAANLAAREYERTLGLSESQVISASLLDQALTRKEGARATCEAAAARIGEARAALVAARVTLEKMVLRAPFDGVVAEISAEEGEWVTPSPPALPIPPVLEMFDPEALYLSVPLDEADVGRVKTAQVVRVTFDAFPGKVFPGTVTRVSSYVLDKVEQNRTFEIEVTLADPLFARTLSPGTSADVEVVLAARDGVLRFPRTALIDGKSVLVLSAGLLVARPVTTGLMNWEWVEAREGLSADEQVVVSLDRPEVKAGAKAAAEASAAP
jgi:HlyD family secretion protein